MIDIKEIKEITQNKKRELIEYYKKVFYKEWEKGIRKSAKKGFSTYSYKLILEYSGEARREAFEEAIKDFRSYGFTIIRYGWYNEEIIISWPEK